MERFSSYLLSKRIVPEKRLRYYLSWITRFYAFCDKSLCDDVSNEEIDSFLRHLMKSREDWQVSQANEAIRLYIYYNRRKCQSKADADIDSDTQWKGVVQDMVRNKELRDVIDYVE